MGGEYLNARRWGHPERPALVVLHGFMGTGADWEGVARSLADRRLVVAPDLPGHGESIGRPIGEYSLEGAADAVLRLMGERPFDLAGYSLGGRLAMHVACAHPGRVRSLVLVSAHPGYSEPGARAGRLAADLERAGRLAAGPEGFLREWFQLPLFQTLSAATVQRLIAERLSSGHPSEWAHALVGLSTGNQEALGAWLQAAPMPITLLTGAKDLAYREVGKELASAPGSSVTWREVSGSGHNLLVESPETVAAAIHSAIGPRGG